LNGVDPKAVFDVLQLQFGECDFKDLKQFVQSGQSIPIGGRHDHEVQTLKQLKIRNSQGVMVALPDVLAFRAIGEKSANTSSTMNRALRGVLTQDFDDRQGETKTLYTAVVFNPVPGPTMRGKTHLSFRYFLKGTDTLRVQLYSLSNGYHRCLMLTGLPQGKWMDGNVDMTQIRKPDGTGGPLSANERIDDIQFYCDPRAELLIDDIVLYDAADEKETRPFPKRFLFTGWFDSGKQGKEWPGSFEIDQKNGYFWHAAKSVPNPNPGFPDVAWIDVDLRGDRPIGAATHLSFRYKLERTNSIILTLTSPTQKKEATITLNGLAKGEWAQTTVDVDAMAPRKLQKGDSIRRVSFFVPRKATLWIDDLLLYEPGGTARK
jgi:hypothetical protein